MTVVLLLFQDMSIVIVTQKNLTTARSGGEYLGKMIPQLIAVAVVFTKVLILLSLFHCLLLPLIC